MTRIRRSPLAACMLLAITACDTTDRDAADEETTVVDPDDLDEWLDEDRQPERAGVPTALVAGIDEPPTSQPGLVPGQPVELDQEVPINIVLIGYEPDEVDAATLLAGLPETYVPRSRVPASYGAGRPLGLSFAFDYEAYYADAGFEDALFEHLQRIGQQGAPTQFQQLYNAQESNLVDVAGPVLRIDATQAEAWLAEHVDEVVPDGRDPGYTVYFIDWYGRDDFQFHVYGRPDQADPDTGAPFGTLDSRQVIGWGGSHHRGWFLDLSAGPEAWSSNWLVDDPDLDGDGIEDYRLPPTWEYAEGGYRSPEALAEDLGLVTRFVAIDMLFTASPVFDPMVTAPGLGGRKVVHIEAFDDDGDPTVAATGLIDPELVADALAELGPHHFWEVELETQDPIDPGARQALRTFTGVEVSDGCWTDYGWPYFQLSCWFTQNLAQYVPAYPEADHVAEVFAFATTDETMGPYLGVLGFADDDYVDGTQTHVYEFSTPTTQAWGYGLTGTTIHELGHHHGLSHPHDGYDSELDVEYGPQGGYFFAWLGSHSDTVMHYLDLSEGFGVFDRDNVHRVEAAGYLELATESLALLEAWEAGHAAPWWLVPLKAGAQQWAKRSRRDYAKWSYLEAAASAKIAHAILLVASEAVGIQPAPVSMLVEPMPHAPRTCEVRMPGQ